MTLLTLLSNGGVDAQTHAPLEVEAELGGPGMGWTNIAADVQRVPSISLDYGISGAGPLDLVAGTGRLTFALDNGQSNSAHLLGYYSPGHANCRSGFALGIGVRLVYRVGGTGTAFYKFSGWIDAIDAMSGLYQERKALVTVVDWMDDAAIFRPNVATQSSKRVDEIATSLVAAVPRQPRGIDFDTGDSTLTYSLDTDLNERDPALTVLQRLAQSEYGRFYIKGDTNTGGVLTFESRTARFAPSSVASFTDTMISLQAPYARTGLINRVKATTHPRTVGTVTTDVLFTLAQTSPTSIHSVAPGATAVIEGDYSDPNNRSSRIGGTDMVTPVATTDFTMNTLATGAGTDLTASFSVSAAYGGNRVKYTIVNNSVSTGFITKLQARGRTLFNYTPVDTIATDTDSITAYGERQIALDMSYESSVPTAQQVGEYVLGVWSAPSAVAVTAPFIPANNTDLATVLAREPGHCVTLTESVTGVSAKYFINHVSMRFEDFQTITFEWVLQRSLATPVVRSRITSSETTNVTSHDVLMPSGIVSGDLLISLVTMDDAATITWPAGWTEFGTQLLAPFNLARASIAYRKADGTEGASIIVTSDSAQESTHVTLRISGAEDPAIQPPEVAYTNVLAQGGIVFPMTAISPTGGKKNYLFLATASFAQLLGLTYTIPSGYGNVSYQDANADGWATAVCERTRNVATEAPGSWYLAPGPTGRNYLTFTVAIHPVAV